MNERHMSTFRWVVDWSYSNSVHKGATGTHLWNTHHGAMGYAIGQSIDQPQKPHNALVLYTTMHYPDQKSAHSFLLMFMPLLAMFEKQWICHINMYKLTGITQAVLQKSQIVSYFIDEFFHSFSPNMYRCIWQWYGVEIIIKSLEPLLPTWINLNLSMDD